MALEASEVAVRVRLLGGSAFEADASKVAASTEGIGAAGAKANKALAASGAGVVTLGSKLDRVGSKMMSFGRTLSVAGIGIAALGYASVKASSQFQSSMMLLYSQAGLPRKNIQGLTQDIKNLSVAVGQTPDTLAKGAFPIVSSGFHDPRKITGLLRLSGIMAAVGHDTVEATANALTSVLNTGFNPKGGATQIAAWLEAAVGAGKMHLPDLTESLNTSILPLLKMTGVSLPQGLAELAALTRQGMNPSSVFSRTRLSLTSVASPTSMGLKAMATLGLSPMELANDLRHGGLLNMLEDLKIHSARFGPTGALDLIAQIFGKSRGIGNIGALLQALPQMQQITQSVMSATPALLQQHFQATEQTSAFKLAQARAALSKAMIDLGDNISKYVVPVLAKLATLAGKLVGAWGQLPGPLREFTLGLMAAVVVGGPLFMFTGALVKGAGMFLNGIEMMVGPMGAAKLETALGATAGAFTTLLPLMAGAALYFGLFHTKVGSSIRHKIEGEGYDFGAQLGEAGVTALSGLGLIHGNVTGAKVFAFEHSSAFKSLSPLVQSDIQALIAAGSPNFLKGPAGSSIIGDLAREPQLNIASIPGIKDSVKKAVEDGVKQAQINIVLPNGRVLAQVVNNQNRRDQNRR